jgi:hypothetical protein
VNGGQAEVERVGEFLKREPGMQGELEDDDEILGLELHAPEHAFHFPESGTGPLVPLFSGNKPAEVVIGR